MQKNKLHVIQGDITQYKVDAIVNAANPQLSAGTGVCGAIHKAAGPQLLTECLSLQGCPTGDAKITKGYHLPARYVIHTVGPVWHGGNQNEAVLLASCYQKTLTLAVKNGIKTIAFPAISCGIYGYPLQEATAIAVKECNHFLMKHSELEAIYFICFDQPTYDAYQGQIEGLVF
ncbi:RNase III inhibitor [Gammaproteobacteria bacterium SCGC AG-212-F23]|nr:RNase III inhibitor [Gammaproteobacteria bacterium SCGC AG-212-F23]